MRHGYAWWEVFWKWLQEQEIKIILSSENIASFDLGPRLRNLKREFEELIRDGKIVVPPKRRET